MSEEIKEEKEESSDIGKEILFLHAGCEVEGVITHIKPESNSEPYLYRAVSKKGIKYCITKKRFIKFL